MQIKVQWWHNCKKPMKKVSYHFKIQHLVVETQTFSTEWFRTGGVIVFTNEPPSLLHQLPNCNRRCFQNEQGPKPRASLHAIKYRGTLLGKFTNGKKHVAPFLVWKWIAISYDGGMSNLTSCGSKQIESFHHGHVATARMSESYVVIIPHMTAVLKDLVHVVATFSPAARKNIK